MSWYQTMYWKKEKKKGNFYLFFSTFSFFMSLPSPQDAKKYGWGERVLKRFLWIFQPILISIFLEFIVFICYIIHLTLRLVLCLNLVCLFYVFFFKQNMGLELNCLGSNLDLVTYLDIVTNCVTMSKLFHLCASVSSSVECRICRIPIVYML